MSSALSLSGKCRHPSLFLRVVSYSCTPSSSTRLLPQSIYSRNIGSFGRRYINSHAKLPAQCSSLNSHTRPEPIVVTQRKASSPSRPFFNISRADAFKLFRKNGVDVSTLSAAQLQSLLDSITRANVACADLQHTEITRLFQWLHYVNPRHVDSAQAAIIEEYLRLIRRSIQELPLLSVSTPTIHFSHAEAQERELFINAVYGLQNLIGVDQRNQNAVFTTHFVDTLAVLFQRREHMQQAKTNRTRSNAKSSTSPPLSPFLSNSILFSRNTVASAAPHSSAGIAHLQRSAPSTRRVRSKIVFASSPKTSFSEYILKCFSDSQAEDHRQNSDRYRYSQGRSRSHRLSNRNGHLSGPVDISGNDIKLVLNGLSLLNSEHEEVRDLLKMVAEEWFPLCNADLTAQQVSLCFAGVRRMSTTHYEVRQVVRVLTSALMNCFESFSALEMCRVISGVQCCDASHPELQQRLLTVVLAKLRYSSSLGRGEEALTVPLFCRALSGLRNINSQNAEGIRLLKRLHRYLRVGGSGSSEPSLLEFSPFQVSKCLDGMRQLGVTDKTTKKLLQTLASGVIYSNDDQWSTSVVCDLLSQMGTLQLSSFEGEGGEVYELLAAVTNKLRVALQQTAMTGRDLGQAMRCVQHMTSDASPVLSLLTVLTDSLASVRHEEGTDTKAACNRGKSYGDVLCGLKNMATDKEEVERFLFAFSDYLNSISRPLSTEEVSLLFLQLRHLKTDTPALRHLVTVLTRLLRECEPGEFSSQEIGLCMFGLCELSNEHEEVRTLLGAIHTRVLFKSRVMMQADDLSLALYGLKSCSTHHPKMNRILSVLRHKAHMVFAKPTQPWADYERMLPMRHAGMLPSVAHSILQQHKDKDRGHYTHEHIHSLNHNDLQEHASNPAFSMHALATALEGVRRLNRGLIGEDRRGNEQAQITLQRVQELQATLLTKLQYTDAPLNLTHLSLFLNAIRFNPTEYYHDRSKKYETNVMKMLAYKCVTKLYVTPSENYQQQIGFVLYHLRRCKVTYHWNKVILLNSVFPQLEQAGVPLDYVNMMYVLHLLVHSKVDHNTGHMRNSTSDALGHLAKHLKWALELKTQSNDSDPQWHWTADMAKDMTDLIRKIRRSRPHAVLEEVLVLIGQIASTPHDV